MMMKMTIGSLSKQTGCKVETIRYYERIGLLADPPRTGGGHRLYREDHTKRLTFIRRSRELGFTLKQIRELLALVDGTSYTCAEVQAITLVHLGEVRKKLSDLRRLEGILAGMAEQCTGGKIPECAVVDALFEPAA